MSAKQRDVCLRVIRWLCYAPALAWLAAAPLAAGDGDASEPVTLYDPARDKIPGGTVTSVALSRDGKLAAAADISPSIKIWNASTNKLAVMIYETDADVSATVPFRISQAAPAGRTRSLAFSPDGRLLAGGGSGKTVERPGGIYLETGELRLWNTSTGELVRNLTHPYEILSVAFDRQGKRIAGGTLDRHVKVWDVATGKLVLDLEHPKSGTGFDNVHAVAFSPDGATLASGGYGTIVLWDAATGRQRLTLHGDTYYPSIEFDPTGRWLAAALAQPGANRAAVQFWDTSSGKPLRTFQGDEYNNHAVAFSPDGTRIAAASGRTAALAGQNFGGSIRVWDAASGNELVAFKLDPEPVMSLAFAPDGKRLLVGYGTYVGLWNVAK